VYRPAGRQSASCCRGEWAVSCMLDPSLYRTPRLTLRPPGPSDAAELFARIGSDPEVTRLVGWPRHTGIQDTAAFLDFAKAEWSRWPVGPLLITSQRDGALLGSTGLVFETPYRASTGFVLAKDAWGCGVASEALGAVVNIAAALRVQRLYALCHVGHEGSVRVLERCGFAREGALRKYAVFPNLGVPEPQDVYCYAQIL